MASESELLGVSRSQQVLLVGVVGAGVTTYGLLSSSAVDAGYDPLAFGVGLVMVVYAVVTFAWDRLRSARG